MRLNAVSYEEKILLREKYNNMDNLLSRIFYASRNIFVFVFERELEKIFQVSGIKCDVLVKGDSRHEIINMTFHNKNKKIERNLFLRRKSVGYTDFGKEVADVFLILEQVSGGEYYPHRKPDFDTMVDNILNDKYFGDSLKDLVLQYFNYPFGESDSFEEKLSKLKSEKDRMEFSTKIVTSVENVLSSYYKGVVKKSIDNKKYTLSLLQEHPDGFLLFLKNNKEDLYTINVNFRKVDITINGIKFKNFENVSISKKLFKRGDSNKKSVNAISKEFEDFLNENNVLNNLVEAVNHLNYPYTYDSKLSC